MGRWHLIIDVDKCHGCYNCMLSCKDEHVGNDWMPYTAAQQLHGAGWIDIPHKDRGQYPLIDVVFRPTPCMHCDDAPCVQASGGAVYKRGDGIVMIDPEKAAGRRELVEACPYGTIRWNDESGIGQKCTLCAHLLDNGWTETRCTQACPTGALQLVKLSDEAMTAQAERERLEALLPQLGTQPMTLYRNLGRFEGCFIAGSVASETDGVMDCAKGARVSLLHEGRGLRKTTTDPFGDFKFDALAEDGDTYEVNVALEGYEDKTVEVELRESRSIGTVVLSPAVSVT